MAWISLAEVKNKCKMQNQIYRITCPYIETIKLGIIKNGLSHYPSPSSDKPFVLKLVLSLRQQLQVSF